LLKIVVENDVILLLNYQIFFLLILASDTFFLYIFFGRGVGAGAEGMSACPLSIGKDSKEIYDMRFTYTECEHVMIEWGNKMSGES
jgi:hypothetical protein